MGSRMAKSMKNSVVGIIGMMCTLILSFVSKSIFIKLLGNEYNGVNYLFTGILNALNLAELGFASAIAFALYKPLSEGDEELTSEPLQSESDPPGCQISSLSGLSLHLNRKYFPSQ